MAIYYENGLWLGMFRDDFREEDLKVEEKQNPTECKYCGCEEVATKTDSEIVFRCWSSYLSADDYWTVSNNCGARCAVQLVELRERVQQAVEVLEKGERFVDYTVSGEALEILRGNSSVNDRGLASRLLPDLAMILMGSRVGKTKCMPWLNLCRELGLTLKDLTDEIKRQGEADGQTE